MTPLELESGSPGGGCVDRLFSGAQRADIGGNGEDVDLVLLMQGIDDRRHRPGRHAVVRMPTVHQIDNELDLAPRLLREIIFVERRRVPTFRATTTIGRRCSRTHDVAWRMARAAVTETFNKVG